MNKIVIDGSNAILGRLASHVAKQALFGKEVSVVNCEKTVVSGNRKVIVEKYKILRIKGGSSLKGPKFPTQPAMIVKRTIRGMLSHKQGRGADALKRVKCYEGLPEEFAESKKETIAQAKGMSTMTLKEISEELR
ncbi:MAG: 50S ribosomal protein L13 [Nanoarchaeota archaeon]